MVEIIENDSRNRLPELVENPLLLDMIALLTNNTYVDTTVAKDWVRVETGYRLSDQLAVYLKALSPNTKPQQSAEELLSVLKNAVADSIPVKASNEHEFVVLLNARNTYRDQIKWDKVIHNPTQVTLPDVVIEKNTFLGQQDIDISLLDEKDFYATMDMQTGDYWKKLLDVPYVTQVWAKKLFDAGILFLTTDDMDAVNDIYADNSHIFTHLIMQNPIWKRYNKWQWPNLRAESWAVWIFDTETSTMQALTQNWYLINNQDELALPILSVKKNTNK